MIYPRVGVLILNWNGWNDTIECLESLFQIEYPNYFVILIDNGSKDNSIANIEQYLREKQENTQQEGHIPFKQYLHKDGKSIETRIGDMSESPYLILIKNERNYGFAEGNNIGIRYLLDKTDVDYILLLNNDTVVNKCFLDKLINISEESIGYGFLGPKTYRYVSSNNNNVIDFAGGIVNLWIGKSFHIGINEIDKGQYNTKMEVDFVEGSCLLLKREVLEDIGLLDPEYFAYWEEVDLCLRGIKSGYRSIYVPDSIIWHKVSSSADSQTKIYYMTRNRFMFMKKNASFAQILVFFAYIIILDFWINCYDFALYKHSPRLLYAFLKGFLDGTKIMLSKNIS